MRLLLSLFLVLILTACHNTESPEAIKEKITSYKNQIKELQLKISQLEKRLPLDSASLAVVRIKVDTLRAIPFSHYIEATGNVEADLDVTVSPESAGKIMHIDAYEGQRVKRGAILGRLNTRAIEEGIEEMKINLELANTIFQRQKNLWDQNIGSEMDYLQAKTRKEALENQLEAMQAQLDYAIIRSPINGVVDRIFQKKGEMANPQVPFGKVVNINKVHVYADISEKFLLQVDAGDTINLRFPAINTQRKATIFRKSDVIDPDNRTFSIRVNLKNPTKIIKPNLVAILQIRDFFEPQGLVVPSILVKNDFRGTYLFTAQNSESGPMAHKNYIQTGRSNNNYTMVTKGLTPGDLIITSGFDQVTHNSSVMIVP